MESFHFIKLMYKSHVYCLCNCCQAYTYDILYTYHLHIITVKFIEIHAETYQSFMFVCLFVFVVFSIVLFSLSVLLCIIGTY